MKLSKIKLSRFDRLDHLYLDAKQVHLASIEAPGWTFLLSKTQWFTQEAKPNDN